MSKKNDNFKNNNNLNRNPATELAAIMNIASIAHKEAYRLFGTRDSVIITGAALVDVLTQLGYTAEPLRVGVEVDPKDKGFEGTSIGYYPDGRSVPEPDLWGGHLAVVTEDRFLIDVTIDCLGDVCPWIRIGPFVGEVPKRFLDGQESFIADHGNCTMTYDAFPGLDGFSDRPDWQDSQLRDVLVRRILRRLAQPSLERLSNSPLRADEETVFKTFHGPLDPPMFTPQVDQSLATVR